MSYKNAAKKFALGPPDGGQAGRDLPLGWRGTRRARVGVSPFGVNPGGGWRLPARGPNSLIEIRSSGLPESHGSWLL